jgi:hypothetical protein
MEMWGKCLGNAWDNLLTPKIQSHMEPGKCLENAWDNLLPDGATQR